MLSPIKFARNLMMPRISKPFAHQWTFSLAENIGVCSFEILGITDSHGAPFKGTHRTIFKGQFSLFNICRLLASQYYLRSFANEYYNLVIMAKVFKGKGGQCHPTDKSSQNILHYLLNLDFLMGSAIHSWKNLGQFFWSLG